MQTRSTLLPNAVQKLTLIIQGHKINQHVVAPTLKIHVSLYRRTKETLDSDNFQEFRENQIDQSIISIISVYFKITTETGT